MSPPATFAVAIHAGAGESYRKDERLRIESCDYLRQLVIDASERVRNGARAVDVAADLTAALEDFPMYNAGRGASLNVLGEHELEAGVVDGPTLEYRAVTGVKRTKNPVRLARSLMEQDRVILLSGPATDEMARQLGLDMVENNYFTTEGRLEYWRQNNNEYSSQAKDYHGTVGAVVLDIHGGLAAANSTGGTMFKPVGRVGDTAVLGSGLYADDRIAVVCSGSGETIMKCTVANHVANAVNHDSSLESAVSSALIKVAQQSIRASCGVIALTANGDLQIQCNSRTFAVASISSEKPAEATIFPPRLAITPQLTFHESANVRVGLSKYPMVPQQAIFELQRGKSVLGLDKDTFQITWHELLEVMCTVRLYANCSAFTCSIIGRYVHIFPTSEASVPDCRSFKPPTSECKPTSQSVWFCLQETLKLHSMENSYAIHKLQVDLEFPASSELENRLVDGTGTFGGFLKVSCPGRVQLDRGLRAATLEELPEVARELGRMMETQNQVLQA